MGLRQCYDRIQAWRSSKLFILVTITLGLFAELFLYGFIVPILPYMLRKRIGIDKHQTQSVTSNLLGMFAGIQILMGPVIGILADRTSRRKSPLLFGLFVALAGTILMAVTVRVSMLYVARTAQGFAASVIWIVGSATLADTVGADNMGKTLGAISIFTTAGQFAGPMVGGLLLETAGYWAAWSTAVGILLVDVLMRLTMLERPRNIALKHEHDVCSNYASCIAEQPIQPGIISFPPEFSIHEARPSSPPRPHTATSGTVSSAKSTSSMITVIRTISITSESSPPFMSDSSNLTPAAETTPLIPTQKVSCSPQGPAKEVSALGFYLLALRQKRIIGAILCSLTFAIIVSAFDATIPLHVQEVFGWGSFPAGMMFFALQAPGALFGPICGWLRDHIGVRYPTSAGYLLIAPLLFALGLPGEVDADWGSGTSGKALYVTILACIGVVNNLVNATGAIECAFIEALEREDPGIFGPNGGYSRLYSIQGVAYTMGMLIGPELAGLLTNTVGYRVMTTVLAVQAIVASVVAFTMLGPRRSNSASIIAREDRREEG